MKKLLMMVLAFVLVATVALIGCKKKEAPKPTGPAVTPMTPAPAPAPAPAPKPAPVKKPAKK